MLLVSFGFEQGGNSNAFGNAEAALRNGYTIVASLTRFSHIIETHEDPEAVLEKLLKSIGPNHSAPEKILITPVVSPLAVHGSERFQVQIYRPALKDLANRMRRMEGGETLPSTRE